MEQVLVKMRQINVLFLNQFKNFLIMTFDSQTNLMERKALKVLHWSLYSFVSTGINIRHCNIQDNVKRIFNKSDLSYIS